MVLKDLYIKMFGQAKGCILTQTVIISPLSLRTFWRIKLIAIKCLIGTFDFIYCGWPSNFLVKGI